MKSRSVPSSPRGDEQDFFAITVEDKRYDPHYFEEIIRREFSFISSVVVFGKESGLLCLVTLRVNPELGGRELATHVLDAAKAHGSGATTVVTARQCPRFRSFLLRKFHELNQDLCLQIHRISVLLQDFTTESGQLRADGTMNRTTIAHRHHNLIDPPLGAAMNPSGCTIDIPHSTISPECHESAMNRYQDWLDEKSQIQEAERIKVTTKRKFNQESLQEISHEENRVPSRRPSSSSIRDSPRNSEGAGLVQQDDSSHKPQRPAPYDYKEWNQNKPDHVEPASSRRPSDDSIKSIAPVKASSDSMVDLGKGQGRTSPADSEGPCACEGVLSPHTAAFCHFARTNAELNSSIQAPEKRAKTFVCPPPSADPSDPARPSGIAEVTTAQTAGASPLSPVSLFKENTAPGGEPTGGGGMPIAPPGAKPRKAQTPRAFGTALSPNRPQSLAAPGGLGRDEKPPGAAEQSAPRPRRRQGLQIAARPGAEVRLVQVCYAPGRLDSDTESRASSGGSDWSIIFDPDGSAVGAGRQAPRRRSSATSTGSASSLENHSPSSSPFQAFRRRLSRTASTGPASAAASGDGGGGQAGLGRAASEPRRRGRVSWGGERGRDHGRRGSAALGGRQGDHSPLWAKLMAPADLPPRPTPAPQALCFESPASAVAAGAGGSLAQTAWPSAGEVLVAASASGDGVAACRGPGQSSGPAGPFPAGRRFAGGGGIAAACRRIRQSLDFRGAPAAAAVAAGGPSRGLLDESSRSTASVESSGPGNATSERRPRAPSLLVAAGVDGRSGGGGDGSTASGITIVGSAGAATVTGGGGGGGSGKMGHCFGVREAGQAGLRDGKRRPSVPRVLEVRPAGQQGTPPLAGADSGCLGASPGSGGPPFRRRSLLECVFPGIGSACKRMRGGSRAEFDDR